MWKPVGNYPDWAAYSLRDRRRVKRKNLVAQNDVGRALGGMARVGKIGRSEACFYPSEIFKLAVSRHPVDQKFINTSHNVGGGEVVLD